MTGRTPSRPLPSLRFRRARALLLLAAIVCLVTLLVRALAGPGTDGLTVPAAVSTVAAPTPPTPTATIQTAVRSWSDREHGRAALAVTDLDTGTQATYGATTHAFATASIVKVDILATLLLQKDGKLSATQKRLAAAMIRQSSNGAATSPWRAIGRAKGLDAANVRFGLTATRGGHGGVWGGTTTTLADQLQLLRVVFTDASPLDAASRAYLRSLMGWVAADQDWGVSAADTRTGQRYFVKNGWLPRTGSRVVNSIGAVEHGGHTLLIAALSDGGASQRRGIDLVELVATNAARAVTGV